MMEIGTEIAGMTVAQSLRRKSAMTPTTRAIVNSRVKRTSARLAAMVWVRSETISTSMPGGSEARSCGSAFLIAATVDVTLAPGIPENGQQNGRLAVEPTCNSSYPGAP